MHTHDYDEPPRRQDMDEAQRAWRETHRRATVAAALLVAISTEHSGRFLFFDMGDEWDA